ncbi:MAG: hypothetical protein QM687_09310 [Ferruginibacter sp.]
MARRQCGSLIGGVQSSRCRQPPSRYYTVRAFDALRQQRFFDAIDAAQALSTGDEELGPVIALAAAPVIGRNDLIDRYRPMIMSNPHYQAGGILPRLAMRSAHGGAVRSAPRGAGAGRHSAGTRSTARSTPTGRTGTGSALVSRRVRVAMRTKARPRSSKFLNATPDFSSWP